MMHKNDSGTVESTLIGLFFSLTFSSVVIAFLLLQFYGVAVTGNNAAISLPSSGLVSGLQDFKSNNVVDNVNYIDGLGKYVYVPDVGRVLSNNPTGLECWLILAHIDDANGVYSVSYDINNSVKEDYGVFVRTWNNFNIYNERIDVKSDGFHAVYATFESGFYPYPLANQNTNVKIRTEFNEDEGTYSFYFNGNLIFTKTGISKPIFSTSDAYYGGVWSKTEGFTIESINAGAFNFSSDNILEQIKSFLNVLAKIVLWNVDEQFLPLALNIIFIKTQLAGIVVCIFVIIRG